MALIYVIEDDEDINELLTYNFRKEGFEVKSFPNGKVAFEHIKEDKPDAVVLDLMMPEVDGLEFCKLVRSDKEIQHTPLIMLTAKSTEIDKIVGLELGADDYVTKPFSFRELLARVKAVIRRAKSYHFPTSKTHYKFGELEIVPEKFEVKIGEKHINLTITQFKLLLALVNAEGRVLSRDYILEHVWKWDKDIYDRTIDVHIKKLREILENYGNCIKTVRGVGYKWECD
ncbi:response regulator transcription factor [Sulfurihydrogenibium sp.]|uniref:response regulator transcription factor n=1 Tax=Sulfurihydrogenibium sp. TaxID=2053621 RepID=UPI002634C843|nr:response regulator transcription factor [Sulfurihydrogenibium sp.]